MSFCTFYLGGWTTEGVVVVFQSELNRIRVHRVGVVTQVLVVEVVE